MVGETLLWIEERPVSASEPMSKLGWWEYFVFTSDGSYELGSSGISRTERDRESGDLLPPGWANSKVVEVRNSAGATVLKLEDGRVIVYEVMFNPFVDSIAPSIDFQSREEAKEWENEYQEMSVLEAI